MTLWRQLRWGLLLASLCCLVESGLAEDMHSVDAVRTAISSPMAARSIQQAIQIDNQILSSHKVGDIAVSFVTDYRDTRVVMLVSKLAAIVPNAAPDGWKVRVLDSNPKVINAFTYGGPIIYVYTGLLDRVQSDDELALILGHELSHAILKHYLRKEESTSNLIGSLLELGGALSRNAKTSASLNLAGGALHAYYSRDDEREADALGAYIADKAGYDPSRGTAFFNRLMQEESNAQAQQQASFAQAKRTIEGQIANCQNLRAQWAAQPLNHTQENANIVNSACQQAETNSTNYNTALAQANAQALASSGLLRTHPVDSERINWISAESTYLRGARPLSSLANGGQGYTVLVAINETGVFDSKPLEKIPEDQPPEPQLAMQSPDWSVNPMKVSIEYQCHYCHSLSYNARGPSYKAIAKQFHNQPLDIARAFANRKDKPMGWGEQACSAPTRQPDSNIQTLLYWISLQ